MPDEIVVSHDIAPMDAAAFLVSLDQLQSEPDMTPLKLQKLLYIAQANYLASTGRRLFSADVEAFEHGPLVYHVWREYMGHDVIRPDAHPRGADVPTDVESFLSAVWQRFGSKSASWLRAYTHAQTPWQKHYDPHGFRCVIPDAEMCEYYRQRVPARERVLHDSVVTVPAAMLEADDDAEAQLLAFLRG